jgi:hypothetical protein
MNSDSNSMTIKTKPQGHYGYLVNYDITMTEKLNSALDKVNINRIIGLHIRYQPIL